MGNIRNLQEEANIPQEGFMWVVLPPLWQTANNIRQVQAEKLSFKNRSLDEINPNVKHSVMTAT